MDRLHFKEDFNRNRTDYRLLNSLDGADEGHEIGGEAWVFSCVDPRGTLYAIKAFKEAQDDEQVQRFIAEARWLNELNHPNVLPVYWLDSHRMELKLGDTTTYQNRPFMVLEQADHSLRKPIQAGTLTTARAVSFGVQAMEGLEHVHQQVGSDNRRIIHRDIKPDNCLLMGNTLKIGDFGIAVRGHTDVATFTRTQIAAGTGPYMPIEQFHGKATVRSDVFSVAATVYEAIAGRRPITLEDDDRNLEAGQLLLAWYRAQKENKVPPIEKLTEDGKIDRIADWVQIPIKKGLSKDPAKRFASVGAMQDAVVEAAERGKAEQRRNRTTIDIFTRRKKPADSSTTGQEDLLKTRILGSPTWHLPDITLVETAVLPDIVQPIKEGAVRRRTLLTGVLGLSAFGPSRDTQARGLGVDPPLSPEANRQLERERKAIVDIADTLLQLMGAGESRPYMMPAIRQLIPYDIGAAMTHIKTLQAAKYYGDVTWLGAFMVPYSREGSQKLVQYLLDEKQYKGALILAVQGSSLVRPSADERTSWQAITQSLLADTSPLAEEAQAGQDILKAAQDPTSDYAAATLKKFRDQTNRWAARALGMAMAPHNPAKVGEEALSWANLAAAAEDSSQAEFRWDVTEDLYRAVIPHAPKLFAENHRRIFDMKYSEAKWSTVKRLILDLSAYDKKAALNHMTGNGSEDPVHWQSEDHSTAVSLAFAGTAPDYFAKLAAQTSEPMLSWMKLALDPTNKTLSDEAYRILTAKARVDYVKKYGSWLLEGLLKSRQPKLYR